MAQLDHSPRPNFARLIQRIQPTPLELRTARSHIASTKNRLQRSFDLKKFQRIGSHARASAIRTFSDLDFLAVLARNEAKWGGSIVSSDTLIRRVSQDLQNRFSATTIRKDKQAVVLHFGSGQNSLDIVPGFFHKFSNGKPIYSIPDGYGDWKETSPAAHNTYINEENRRSREKLKKAGQLIRFWKHKRSPAIPISSFYIDLALAHSGVCIGIRSYPAILFEFFHYIADRECRGLRDPLGIAGVVHPSHTAHQINALKARVQHSLQHAEKALVAERARQFRESNRQWNIVFNQRFL